VRIGGLCIIAAPARRRCPGPNLRKGKSGSMFASIARLVAVAALAASLSPTAGLASDPVVAKLNGQEIRQSDVLRARGRLPASLRDKPAEQIVPMLTTIVINSRLLADEARSQGIDREPQVQRQIDLVTDLVLEQELLDRYIEKQLTEAAIRARYEKLAAEAAGSEQIRARHILLRSEDDARDVIQSLGAGRSFEALARDRSTDPTADTGGDLGYFTRGEMAEPFSDAAFKLQPGQFTRNPVQTEFGWHVILVEDRRPAVAPPLSQVRDKIRNLLVAELRNEYLASLRGKATVERFDR
jgi:peptidyl-prolyl cis-trans isomerase C